MGRETQDTGHKKTGERSPVIPLRNASGYLSCFAYPRPLDSSRNRRKKQSRLTPKIRVTEVDGSGTLPKSSVTEIPKTPSVSNSQPVPWLTAPPKSKLSRMANSQESPPPPSQNAALMVVLRPVEGMLNVARVQLCPRPFPNQRMLPPVLRSPPVSPVPPMLFALALLSPMYVTPGSSIYPPSSEPNPIVY
jgi:hypothetical protein